MPPVVIHPLLHSGVSQARAYQLDAVRAALGANTLLVLPTGLGKTPIAWMVIAQRLHSCDGWVLMVAPSVPLVNQHLREAHKWLRLEEDQALSLTGRISPAKRLPIYGTARLIIATPEVIRNDVISGNLDLTNCCLLVADEAHHATGNHAMAQVGDLYCENSAHGLILGCTASPGSSEQQVEEVCARLGIDRIISRKATDHMLVPYRQEMNVVEKRLPIPEEIAEIAEPISAMLDDLASRLQKAGFLVMKGGYSMRAFLDSQQRISMAIRNGRKTAYAAAGQNANAQRLVNLLYMLQGQGVGAALLHLQRMEESAERGSASEKFLAQPQIRGLLGQLRAMREVHPKIPEVQALVSDKLRSDSNSRVIVFATWRDSVALIEEVLNRLDGVKAERFVGQSKRGEELGMKQKEQVESLDRFRSGEANVLICTSVGEEGLDIPSADRVIFYEPVASEIRTIQRRGRTARHREGDVFVLVSEGTRDEGVRHAAAAKEVRMIRVLEKVRRRRRPPLIHPNPDKFISSFSIESDEVTSSGAEFIEAERKRLQPRLGHGQSPLQSDRGKGADAPATTIIRQEAPPLRPEALRPRSQKPITDYVEEPAPQPTPPLIQPLRDEPQLAPTDRDEDKRWRRPVLDGSQVEAAEDIVQRYLSEEEEGLDDDPGKV